jgi:hypothetical protein
LSQNQALASISGRLVSLPVPPVRLNNRWYVPVEFIGRALSLVYDTPLELRKASRLVIMGPMRVPRVVVHHDIVGAQARVTLDVVPNVPHQVLQEPSRLLIRFTADLLDLTLPSDAVAGLRDRHPHWRAPDNARDRAWAEIRIRAVRGCAAGPRRRARDAGPVPRAGGAACNRNTRRTGTWGTERTSRTQRTSRTTRTQRTDSEDNRP